MKYKLNVTGRFRRDCKKHGYLIAEDKFKEPLDRAIKILLSGQTLPAEFDDHKLKGIWKGKREFHVEFDLVCVYEIKANSLIIEALRLGTHKEVFGYLDIDA